MTETELVEALAAELAEYGEVFVPDDEMDGIVGLTWQQMHRALAYEMATKHGAQGTVLDVFRDMIKQGVLIKRREGERGWSGPPPEDAKYDLQRDEWTWVAPGGRHHRMANETVARLFPSWRSRNWRRAEHQPWCLAVVWGVAAACNCTRGHQQAWERRRNQGNHVTHEHFSWEGHAS